MTEAHRWLKVHGFGESGEFEDDEVGERMERLLQGDPGATREHAEGFPLPFRWMFSDGSAVAICFDNWECELRCTVCGIYRPQPTGAICSHCGQDHAIERGKDATSHSGQDEEYIAVLEEERDRANDATVHSVARAAALAARNSLLDAKLKECESTLKVLGYELNWSVETGFPRLCILPVGPEPQARNDGRELGDQQVAALELKSSQYEYQSAICRTALESLRKDVATVIRLLNTAEFTNKYSSLEMARMLTHTLSYALGEIEWDGSPRQAVPSEINEQGG